MIYIFIATKPTTSWSSNKSQQDHRWIIIGILIGSIVCCYVYVQCLLPYIVRRLVNLGKFQ
jgi:hypothetical protein